MKIIIVGGGISGLSTYLFLQKHVLSLPNQHFEIKIYESYDISKYIGKFCTPTLSISKQDAQEISESESLGEPTFTPEAIASAIGISRNGLDVLSRICDEDQVSRDGLSGILSNMLEEGNPATRWQMSNARGWMLADINMSPKGPSGPARVGKQEGGLSSENTKDGRIGEDSCVDKSPASLIMISRQAFWSILLKYVLAQDRRVIQHRKVIDLVIPPEPSADKTVVKFADGTEEVADLVIGADGLRSVVRKAMFRTPLPSPSASATRSDKPGFLPWLLSFFKPSIATGGKDYVTPHYEGLVGVGSFIPSSLLTSTNVPPEVMSVVFGPNGFFGYGYITSSTNQARSDSVNQSSTPSNPANLEDVAVFWSTFASESENPFPLPSTTPTATSSTKPYDFDKPTALKSLLTRHSQWKNPTVQAILKYVEETGRLDGFWPTWTTPELPSWHKNGRAVLVGDAAHALQPSSGQGACQALEDAEALSLLLRHYLSRATSPKPTMTGNIVDLDAHAIRRSITQTLQKFDELRIPRLHKIYERSQRMSGMKNDTGFVGEMLMYAAIWMMSKIGGGGQEEVFGYDLPGDVERVVIEGRDMY